MSRWWESDRSKLAASVRSTRRRLRAGFRGAVSASVARATARVESAASIRMQSAEARAVAAEKRAEDVVSGFSRVVLHRIDHHLTSRLVVEISLDQRMLTAVNESAFRREVGAVLGRQVENAVKEGQ